MEEIWGRIWGRMVVWMVILLYLRLQLPMQLLLLYHRMDPNNRPKYSIPMFQIAFLPIPQRDVVIHEGIVLILIRILIMQQPMKMRLQMQLQMHRRHSNPILTIGNNHHCKFRLRTFEFLMVPRRNVAIQEGIVQAVQVVVFV